MSIPKTKPKRSVTAAASFGTNFVYHPLAVAEVGFSSDYAKRYAHTVRLSDIEFLQQHRSLLTFGHGTGGNLVDVAIGLPLQLELTDQHEFQNYYANLDHALAKGSFSRLFDRYDLNPQRFFPFFVMDAEDFGHLIEYRDLIRTLGEIYVRGFESFEREVWPTEKPDLVRVAKQVNRALKGMALIASWEEMTGQTYRQSEYQVDLCSGIKNGPNANSITYGRVVFYSGTGFDWMLDFISHEIGIHLMFEWYRELNESGLHDRAVLYQAFETLARFLNHRVLKLKLNYELPESYRQGAFEEFYAVQLVRFPKMTPRDLLRTAVSKSRR